MRFLILVLLVALGWFVMREYFPSEFAERADDRKQSGPHTDPAVAAIDRDIAEMEAHQAQVEAAAAQETAPGARASFQAESRRLSERIRSAKIRRDTLLNPPPQIPQL